jgi:hypothetical protein
MKYLPRPNIGDTFLCKRYFNSKRIIYVPSRLISISPEPFMRWATLEDLEMGDTYRVVMNTLDYTKPLADSWIFYKIQNLKADKEYIEKHIQNLENLFNDKTGSNTRNA